MSGGLMPLWLLVPWSAAMTVAVFWQPRWIHRLFNRLASHIDPAAVAVKSRSKR